MDMEKLEVAFKEDSIPTHPFVKAKVWLIAASAGCGKTYTIERTINELLDQGTPPENIMYCTFNKAIAEEFRSRYPQFDNAQKQHWKTHHAIALNLLRRNGFKADPFADESKFKKKLDLFRKTYKYPPQLLSDTFPELDKLVFNKTPKESWPPRCIRLYQQLSEFAHKTGNYHFTLIIKHAIELGLFPDNVEYVFVDEGQDNGKIQHDYWLNVINTAPNLKGFMMVGDDKQAIYSFKGGDAKAFLSFATANKWSIPATHRCPQKVLDQANRVASKISIRSPLVQTTKVPHEGEVLHFATLEDACPVLKEKQGRKLILGITRKSLSRAKKTLIENDIPFKTKAYQNIAKVMRSFESMRTTNIMFEADYLDLYAFKEERRQDGSLKKKAYFKHGFTHWLEDSQKKQNNLSFEQQLFSDEASRFEPVPLAEVLDPKHKLGLKPVILEHIKRGYPDPDMFHNVKPTEAQKIIRWIKKYGADYEGVELSTIHSAKGLEAETVVVLRDSSRLFLDEEMFNSDAVRRVYYTALTRAKDTLIITQAEPWPKHITNLI